MHTPEVNSLAIRALAGWYGLYQAVHIAVNIHGIPKVLDGSIGFPASPPQGGWPTATLAFLLPMAVLDLVNAMVSLGFVWGVWRGRVWAIPLGLVTLSVSLYAAVVFVWGTAQSGAWEGHLGSQLLVTVTFLPNVWLFGRLVHKAARGARGEGSAT